MEDKREKYAELRRRYPLFEYLGYRHDLFRDGLRMQFDFRMGGVEFHPETWIESRSFLDFGIGKDELDRLVFDIGMAELPSYWKSACPPVVRVCCGSLSPARVAFWKKLYWNGLGEFFYTNGLDETEQGFMELECGTEGESRPRPSNRPAGERSYLVPVGGGKDSVVTLETLRRGGLGVRPLIMNPRGATRACAQVAGFAMEEVLVIRRTIDPMLLELNRKGYLNGHTPFSAMLAFYTRLASAVSGVCNVALSNESSANESTVIGSYVNHQYSKSLEFENDFRAYCAGDFNYFSFLRPLSELQIAMIFSELTPYHDIFRSCNAGSKEDIWCGKCAKCLFAYIILSPFFDPKRLESIFGKGMLDDESLEPVFRQLCGAAPTKPFECVGTVGEVLTALSMATERWYAQSRPALLARFEPLPPSQRVSLQGLLPEGNLSDEERNLLKQCIEKSS